MGRGDPEWIALQRAMQHDDPACVDMPEFVAEPEDIRPDTIQAMKRICRACPLAEPCAAYALAARPTGGMWAGTHYSRKKTQ